MANLIGQTLLGQYYVEEYIDSGGMGAVFRVRDLKRNVYLAMKTLHSEMAEDASVMKRFRREAVALSKLSHPHIVRIYGLYQADGLVFLLQDFIDGMSLKKLLDIRDKKPLTIPESLTVMKVLCSALGFAHANGVIHCDIKPANVMLDHAGEVFLTDFGIARHADSTTTTLAQAGAPAYMSPEQILGKPVNAATDIYSLGVMLFEMLTGRRPFLGSEESTRQAGESTAERLRYAHLHIQPPNPITMNPNISEKLAAVMLKSLAKKPSQRYQSASEFLRALASSTGQEIERIPQILPLPKTLGATIKQPVPPIEKRYQPTGQNKGNAGLYFAMGAIALTALMFILFSGRDGRTVTTISDDQPTIRAIPQETLLPQKDDAALPSEAEIPDSATMSAPMAGSDHPTGKIVYTCQVDRQINHDQICLINADGSMKRQLTNDLRYQHYYASLSPDGNSIVFSSSRSGGMNIFEMDVDGNNIKQLTSGIGECFAPEISPDGHLVVFLRNQDGKNYISLMKRDGTFLGDLNDHYDCKDPTWSPDGSQILFASSQSGSPQFYTMNSDGSNVRKITEMAGFRGRCDWGPDWIMASYAGNTDKHNREIYFFDDSTAPVSITSGGDNLAPSFSPDGNWITFMSYRNHFWDSDGCEIYIMRLDENNIQRLTNNDYCDYQPRWGP